MLLSAAGNVDHSKFVCIWGGDGLLHLFLRNRGRGKLATQKHTHKAGLLVSVKIVCKRGEGRETATLMELDWYSKKVFASNSARRVATLTSFMSVVGQRLMLVKPLYKRLSSSISSKSLPATATYSHKQEFDDLDDNFLDFQPKCMSLGRSRKWIMSQLDERARRKQHITCFACVLHI